MPFSYTIHYILPLLLISCWCPHLMEYKPNWCHDYSSQFQGIMAYEKLHFFFLKKPCFFIFILSQPSDIQHVYCLTMCIALTPKLKPTTRLNVDFDHVAHDGDGLKVGSLELGERDIWWNDVGEITGWKWGFSSVFKDSPYCMGEVSRLVFTEHW